MGKKLVVDSDKLIEAIESGITSKQIMVDFGIKTSAQLKTLYIDALVTTGRIASVISRIPKEDPYSARKSGVSVNKRGSLIITKEIIDELGYAIGNNFSLRRTKSGISLRKI